MKLLLIDDNSIYFSFTIVIIKKVPHHFLNIIAMELEYRLCSHAPLLKKRDPSLILSLKGMHFYCQHQKPKVSQKIHRD